MKPNFDLPNNSTDYKGQLAKLQTEGSRSKFNHIRPKPEFNSYQNFLYKRTILGLRFYSSKQVQRMSRERKNQIREEHTKVQNILNIFKQERVNKVCNSIYHSYFKDNPIAKVFLSDEVIDTDTHYRNTMSFRELFIDKNEIIERLIENDILPENFYELKEAI